MANTKRILIITGDGGESYETLYAKHRMAEAGHKAQIASTSRKRLNLVIHDFEPGWDTYIERQGYGLESDLSFDEVDTDEFDAILIPGGRSPEYLRNHPTLINIVREFYQSGKFIFAICHGIQILVTAGLVDGRRITCYEHVKFEVESCGGTFVADRQAVRDGKIITGQTWQSHPEFYREVFACLNE